MEEFTCAIYGRQRVKSTDKLRHILINEKCKSTDGEIQVDKKTLSSAEFHLVVEF